MFVRVFGVLGVLGVLCVCCGAGFPASRSSFFCNSRKVSATKLLQRCYEACYHTSVGALNNLPVNGWEGTP